MSPRRTTKGERKKFGWLAESQRLKGMPEANKRVARAQQALRGESEFSAAKKIEAPPEGKPKK